MYTHTHLIYRKLTVSGHTGVRYDMGGNLNCMLFSKSIGVEGQMGKTFGFLIQWVLRS